MARRSPSSSRRTATTTPCPSRSSRTAQPLPGPIDDPVRTNGDTGRHYEYRPPPNSCRAGVNRAPTATRGPLIGSACSSAPGHCSSPSSWRRSQWCRGRSELGAFAVAVAVDDTTRGRCTGHHEVRFARSYLAVRELLFGRAIWFATHCRNRHGGVLALRGSSLVCSAGSQRVSGWAAVGARRGDRRRERGVRFELRDRSGSARRHRSGPRWVSGPAHAGHVASSPPDSDARNSGKHGGQFGTFGPPSSRVPPCTV
jgi:hypothetical protein